MPRRSGPAGGVAGTMEGACEQKTWRHGRHALFSPRLREGESRPLPGVAVRPGAPPRRERLQARRPEGRPPHARRGQVPARPRPRRPPGRTKRPAAARPRPPAPRPPRPRPRRRAALGPGGAPAGPADLAGDRPGPPAGGTRRRRLRGLLFQRARPARRGRLGRRQGRRPRPAARVRQRPGGPVEGRRLPRRTAGAGGGHGLHLGDAARVAFPGGVPAGAPAGGHPHAPHRRLAGPDPGPARECRRPAGRRRPGCRHSQGDPGRGRRRRRRGRGGCPSRWSGRARHADSHPALLWGGPVGYVWLTPRGCRASACLPGRSAGAGRCGPGSASRGRCRGTGRSWRRCRRG